VRVLLVEDNKHLARALRQGLEEEGFAVDSAEDGDEADHKAKVTGYDAIVLDLMLPKKDGLTLLRGWRAHGVKAPVLVLTARGTLDDKVKASTPGRTTTSQNRSSWRSCSPGCGRSSAAATRLRTRS